MKCVPALIEVAVRRPHTRIRGVVSSWQAGGANDKKSRSSAIKTSCLQFLEYKYRENLTCDQCKSRGLRCADWKHTVRKAQGALLHQLFSQKPGLLVHAMKQYDKDGDGLVNSTSSLWSVFGDAVQDANAGSITIVLDALDECAESETKDFMRCIKTQVQNGESSNAKLKLFMTSRPYEHVVSVPELHCLSEAFPRIRIPGEDESESISQEVNCVIRCRVDLFAKERRLADEIKTCLEDHLLKMEHRTYLWAYLVFDYLEGCCFKRTRNGMASEFSKLPESVDQAYEQILNKSKDRPKVKKALAIILAATRPLMLSEMNIAMEVGESTTSVDDLDLEKADDFKSSLRSWCGLFVSVYHSSTECCLSFMRSLLSQIE